MNLKNPPNSLKKHFRKHKRMFHLTFSDINVQRAEINIRFQPSFKSTNYQGFWKVSPFKRDGYDNRVWDPQRIARSLPGISPAVPALCQTKWVSQRTKSFQATDGIYSNPLLLCPTKVGRDWQPLSWHKIHSNFSMAEYVRQSWLLEAINYKSWQNKNCFSINSVQKAAFNGRWITTNLIFAAKLHLFW